MGQEQKKEDVLSVATCVRTKMSAEECVTLVSARSCGNYCSLTSAPTSTPLLVSHEESELPSRAGGRGGGEGKQAPGMASIPCCVPWVQCSPTARPQTPVLQNEGIGLHPQPINLYSLWRFLTFWGTSFENLIKLTPEEKAHVLKFWLAISGKLMDFPKLIHEALGVHGPPVKPYDCIVWCLYDCIVQCGNL